MKGDRKVSAKTYLHVACDVMGMAVYDLKNKEIGAKIQELQKSTLDLIAEIERLKCGKTR